MGGDQKSPSIFLIFKYVNKQDALILNLASKVVYDNNIKSYEQFKFANLRFKANFRCGNQPKITMVKKDLLEVKTEKSFQFFFKKMRFYVQKYEKN